MQRSPKLAEQVAASIKNEVVARGWPVGEYLGSEAELIARYGVSRATIREAVSILEHTQLAAMHQGRGGGLVVKQPAAGVVARTVAGYVYLAGLSVDELYAVRTQLQVLAVRLATQRISEREVASLRALVSQPLPLDEGIEVALGQVSGNPVLAILIPTLTRVTGMWAGAPRGAQLAGPEAQGRLRAWQLIVDAMIGGDSATAERRMSRHLMADRKWLDSHLSARTPRLGGTQGGKLAERIAEALAVEVLQHGPGYQIGSEAELVARLGVGRSPLRQAIRILEHHGVVRMREGSAGGLVVVEPDPTEIVDALALYLRYIDVDVASIFQVRTALEVEAAGVAAQKSDAALLLADDPGELAETRPGSDVHVRISEIAGNRLTTLLIRALAGVLKLRAEFHPSNPATSVSTAGGSHAHWLILEAIKQGDASLARYRMGRHLAARAERTAGVRTREPAGGTE